MLWEEDLADSRRLQLARIAERELELLETRTLALGVSETWFPQSLPASDVGSIELGYGALVGSEDEAEPVVVSSVSCVVSN